MLTDLGVTVDIRSGAQKGPLSLASCKGVEASRFLIERGIHENAGVLTQTKGCRQMVDVGDMSTRRGKGEYGRE
jgi:hypothetical protein